MAFNFDEPFEVIYSPDDEETSGIATTFGYNDSEDNGIGAWGTPTNNPDIMGVSLPRSVLRSHFGDENKAKGAMVEVLNPENGKRIIAPIVDKGPADWVIDRQGPTIDLTHAANQAIGGSGRTEVKYKILGDFGSFDPNKPFEVVDDGDSQTNSKGFDPNQPFEIVDDAGATPVEENPPTAQLATATPKIAGDLKLKKWIDPYGTVVSRPLSAKVSRSESEEVPEKQSDWMDAAKAFAGGIADSALRIPQGVYTQAAGGVESVGREFFTEFGPKQKEYNDLIKERERLQYFRDKESQVEQKVPRKLSILESLSKSDPQNIGGKPEKDVFSSIYEKEGDPINKLGAEYKSDSGANLYDKRISEINSRVQEIKNEGEKAYRESTLSGVGDEYQRLSDKLGEIRKGYRDFYNVDEDFQKSFGGKLVSAAGEFVPQILAGSLGGIGVAALQSQAFQASWDDAKETALRHGEEFSPEKAYAYAFSDSLQQALLEKVGLNATLSNSAKKTAALTIGEGVKRVAKSILAEGGTEAVQGAGSDTLAGIFDIEKRNPLDLEKRATEFAIGGILGGGVATGGVAAQGVSEYQQGSFARKLQSEAEAIRKIQKEKQVASEQSEVQEIPQTYKNFSDIPLEKKESENLPEHPSISNPDQGPTTDEDLDRMIQEYQQEEDEFYKESQQSLFSKGELESSAMMESAGSLERPRFAQTPFTVKEREGIPAKAENWLGIMNSVAPGAAKRLRLVIASRQEAARMMTAIEKKLPTKPTGVEIPDTAHAAIHKDVVYLFNEALGTYKNQRAEGLRRLQHEIGHAWWDTLGTREQDALERLWKAETSAKVGSLYNEDGIIKPEVMDRVEDDVQEWLGEKIAEENSKWAEARANATEHDGRIVSKVAAKLRGFLFDARQAIFPNKSRTTIAKEFRNVLKRGKGTTGGREIAQGRGDVLLASAGNLDEEKRLSRLIEQFKSDLDQTLLNDEQKGIYEVVSGESDLTQIRKGDLDALEDYVKFESGHARLGAKHVLLDHYSGNRGPVTAQEIVDMGNVIRSGAFSEKDGRHVYEWRSPENVRFRVIVGANPSGETVISFFSNRKREAGSHNAHQLDASLNRNEASGSGDVNPRFPQRLNPESKDIRFATGKSIPSTGPQVRPIIQMPLSVVKGLTGKTYRDWSNPAPGVARLWRGTADVFDNTPGLEFLGKAIRKHVDTARMYQGQMMAAFRKLHRKTPAKDWDQALKEFEGYFKEQERNPTLAAQAYRLGSQAGRNLIDLWKDAANKTGDINQENNLNVFDGELGIWRPIGRVSNYFPRMVKQDVLKILANPQKNPSGREELIREMIADGIVDDENQATNMVNKAAQSYASNDHFNAIEKARSLKLPANAYDYSFDAARRYLMAWSERMAQIESFGQKIGDKGKDLFDRAQELTVDEPTKKYIKSVQDRAYGVRADTPAGRFANTSNQLATGMHLGNPLSTIKNLLSGMTMAGTFYGTRRMVGALLDVRNAFDNIEDAYEKGIIHDDLMNLLEDRGLQQSKVSSFTNFMLTASGFNAAETWVRVVNMGAANSFLRHAIKSNLKNPGSRASLQYRGFIARLGIKQVQALLDEGGDGPLTDSFLRKAVNEVQGGYRYDQVPAFMDSPVGRFFFKYQKWGSQQMRAFLRHIVNPFLTATTFGAIGKTELIRYRDPKTGNVITKKVPGAVMPAFRYLLILALAGAGTEELLHLLFGRPYMEASWSEIAMAMTKDQKEAIGMALNKLWLYHVMAGSMGSISNYAQVGMDFATRSRFKNPLDPPAFSIFKSTVNLALDWMQQGRVTLADLDKFTRDNLSAYRTLKDFSATQLNRAGAEFKWAKLNASRQDSTWIRMQTDRFNKTIGAKQKQTQRDRREKNEQTPFRDGLKEDLRVGDIQGARKRLNEWLSKIPQEKRKVSLLALAVSVRSSQPIRAGSGSGELRGAFLQWARQNLPKESVMRIQKIDKTYRESAISLGLMKPGDPDNLDIAKALMKYGK